MNTEIEPKTEIQNAFDIEDMMRLMKIKCRATFYRKRLKGIVPKPDVDDSSPRWFRASLKKTMPNLIAD